MPLILDSHKAGASGELLVAYRFIDAGRIPSWPLLPCRYDLLVDTGDAIYRVQVRRMSKGMNQTGGGYQWQCDLRSNRKVLLAITAFDYLCAIADPNRIYVIPSGALHCAHDPSRLVARLEVYEKGTRFEPYLNRFDLGAGEPPAVGTLKPLTTLPRGMWHSAPKSGRKAHRRLTVADVAAIQALPIAVYKRDEAPGRVPLNQVAQQFGVHPATVRNLLRGLRKDLQGPAGGG